MDTDLPQIHRNQREPCFGIRPWNDLLPELYTLGINPAYYTGEGRWCQTFVLT
jgi:hypothetical protein